MLHSGMASLYPHVFVIIVQAAFDAESYLGGIVSSIQVRCVAICMFFFAMIVQAAFDAETYLGGSVCSIQVRCLAIRMCFLP